MTDSGMLCNEKLMLLNLMVLEFSHEKALGCKQMYQIKLKFDGSVECYKTCHIILGSTQVEGENFNETFSYVAKLVTLYSLGRGCCKGMGTSQKGYI